MQFRLLEAHYLNTTDGHQAYVLGDKERSGDGPELGTKVGDGTPYIVKWPTLSMEPLDDEARAMIEREKQRIAENDGSFDPIEYAALEDYEREYVPGLNIRRREPLPDGAPVPAAHKRK